MKRTSILIGGKQFFSQFKWVIYVKYVTNLDKLHDKHHEQCAKKTIILVKNQLLLKKSTLYKQSIMFVALQMVKTILPLATQKTPFAHPFENQSAEKIFFDRKTFLQKNFTGTFTKW